MYCHYDQTHLSYIVEYRRSKTRCQVTATATTKRGKSGATGSPIVLCKCFSRKLRFEQSSGKTMKTQSSELKTHTHTRKKQAKRRLLVQMRKKLGSWQTEDQQIEAKQQLQKAHRVEKTAASQTKQQIPFSLPISRRAYTLYQCVYVISECTPTCVCVCAGSRVNRLQLLRIQVIIIDSPMLPPVRIET